MSSDLGIDRPARAAPSPSLPDAPRREKPGRSASVAPAPAGTGSHQRAGDPATTRWHGPRPISVHRKMRPWDRCRSPPTSLYSCPKTGPCVRGGGRTRQSRIAVRERDGIVTRASAGSFALFTSAASAQGDNVSAGTVTLGQSGAAVCTGEDLAPGQRHVHLQSHVHGLARRLGRPGGDDLVHRRIPVPAPGFGDRARR